MTAYYNNRSPFTVSTYIRDTRNGGDKTGTINPRHIQLNYSQITAMKKRPLQVAFSYLIDHFYQQSIMATKLSAAQRAKTYVSRFFSVRRGVFPPNRPEYTSFSPE